MKKLTKAQSARLAELTESLDKARGAVKKQHDAVIAAISDLNSEIEAYNGVLEEVAAFRDEIVQAMDDYAGERSEKWSEGDAGQAFEAWKGEWENIDLDAFDAVDDIEEPQLDHVEHLGDLPQEVE